MIAILYWILVIATIIISGFLGVMTYKKIDGTKIFRIITAVVVFSVIAWIGWFISTFVAMNCY